MDRIHHIAVVVEDIQTTLDWYVNEFDVTIGYQDDTWALIHFENTSLALVMKDQHPAHFAIEKDNASDYGTLTPHRDHTASVYIQDPSKNYVEIIKVP